ncbi:P1 family peptidase [Lutibaculum baratangense]|uniref:Peptidase, T4 family n=1 Tax=Lutibaculum baratangense AMV1 TaxID=631454 RepID=V4T766_9HYPH|nr:P1 family peptidase [Lutibaculum baratangense]ESR22458.1 Peptidase, T4 family [Lutibaculum baratangense AMV1]
MRPGPRNALTDVHGLAVGHAEDAALLSGTTVVLCDAPATAGVDVRGGGPGTRETALLAPEMTVPGVDAIVLSGGSAFGLDAASGVQAFLRAAGRGFEVAGHRVPIVPGAILFDLANGGDKGWGRYPPYRDLGWRAAEAAGADFALGSVGAGLGATTANYRGGVGSASLVLDNGCTVAALAVVNAVGRATVGEGPHFWAGAWEIGGEFGGHGLPCPVPAEALLPLTKGETPGAATTLAVVATDAALSKPETSRLATMAQDGMARALHPIHTPLDGDIVFALATGRRELVSPLRDMVRIGSAAAICLARAIARGVYEAGAAGAGSALLPAYRDRFSR